MNKNKNLRIVFIGTPDFAVESLKRIHQSGRTIAAVVTAPDKKSGRGQQLQFSAVKKYALSENLPLLQPTNLKDTDFLQQLKSFSADLQIVVAFRMLPEVVWNMPPLGTMNLHASLLPKYRGAAPINHVIINGEKETGLSTFLLKHKIDTGDILLQEKLQIAARETAGSLHDRLMKAGGELLLKSLEKIESGDVQLKRQTELSVNSPIPKAPKIFKEDGLISWEQTAEKIDRLVRGLNPYPAAWTMLYHPEKEKKYQLKIFTVKILDETAKSPATIELDQGKLKISCLDQKLEVVEVQLEGKRKMKTADLLNGFKIEKCIIIKENQK